MSHWTAFSPEEPFFLAQIERSIKLSHITVKCGGSVAFACWLWLSISNFQPLNNILEFYVGEDMLVFIPIRVTWDFMDASNVPTCAVVGHSWSTWKLRTNNTCNIKSASWERKTITWLNIPVEKYVPVVSNCLRAVRTASGFLRLPNSLSESLQRKWFPINTGELLSYGPWFANQGELCLFTSSESCTYFDQYGFCPDKSCATVHCLLSLKRQWDPNKAFESCSVSIFACNWRSTLLTKVSNFLKEERTPVIWPS